MQTRKLGRHDLELSVLGFGGIVVCDRPQDEADDEVAAAVDRGVTYFDVAPQYSDAQERLGPALRPFRKDVTLACKTLMRRGPEAAADLDDSLRKLRTDRFDIYQLHAMTTPEDADAALAPGGALDVVLRARDAGKVRLVGFSAHDEAVALRLIETEQFDTVLYPLNVRPFEAGVFGPGVLEAATSRGMGVLALKAMARARVADGEDRPYAKCWYHPEDRPDLAHLLLRYTLNLPGVCAALPPGDPDLFRLALDLVETHGIAPLSAEELATLTQAMPAAAPIFPEPV
ncbi:MAG: aldo/keto reductase [Planctomycetota bacterium]